MIFFLNSVSYLFGDQFVSLKINTFIFDRSKQVGHQIHIKSEKITTLPKIHKYILHEKCREIFVKSRIEGKKHAEIAAELNISTKTVENQMTIAYKKLRSSLKDYLPLLLFLLG